MKNKYVLNLEDIPVKQAHMFNINKLNEFLAGKVVSSNTLPSKYSMI